MDDSGAAIIFLIIFGVVALFSFVTMKFFWLNRIFGILYQGARGFMCLVLLIESNGADEDMIIPCCILFFILEFFIITNLIGLNGIQDTRHLVEKVSQAFIPGELEGEGESITRVITTMEGDSSFGNLMKSLGWAFFGAVVFAVGVYFLLEFKFVLTLIGLLVFSIVRIVLLVLTIIRRNS